MIFPVVMYRCGSWTIKKAERRRTDAFELWCWRRLLRVSWTARRSNQSILKKISPEYSLEKLILKLTLQYFGHLMQRNESLENSLMLGQIEKRRRRGPLRMRWLDGPLMPVQGRKSDGLVPSLQRGAGWLQSGLALSRSHLTNMELLTMREGRDS